ncbi:MAG: SiaB family protein kinase [Bacteroidales bacterium]|nr:SiaB family protein kinase [Bacteroidales bacterium]
MTRFSELKNAVKLFDAMVKDNLGFIYRGSFNDDITDSILELTEVSLQTEEQSSKIKKRVYAIMVEGLQNITRHQDSSPEIKSDHKSIFVIQKIEEKYYITTGNIIEEQHIENVKHLIEKINKLSKEELKVYYKQVLEEGTLSDKGGAGLGLIDMAKKSGNRLSYHFKKLSDGMYYFYLHTIPTLSDGADVELDGKSDSLDHIVDIHNILNQEDVLLIFNGIFNQDTFSSLIQSLQKNISETKDLKNKLFYIISEMTKNIVKHGFKVDASHFGNPGVFYLSQLKDKYLITTGNFILNERVSEFTNHINKINQFSHKEVDQNYKTILFSQKKDDKDHMKFGLLDLRKESEHKICYDIAEIDNDKSFVSIRVELHP